MSDLTDKVLYQAFSNQLRSILDWWTDNMIDHVHGGFYGRIDGSGKLHAEAGKGVILNTRILWAFAAAARLTGENRYGQVARLAYTYLTRYFLDHVHGGVIWSVHADGTPEDMRKQVYAQAFAIYALSEYCLLTRDEQAYNDAVSIFSLLQKHSHDPLYGGYIEAFDRIWADIEDHRLSDKELNAAKTMNTHLHVLEAYTHLFRVRKTDRLREALVDLTGCYMERFVGEDGHLHLFFDPEWKLLSGNVSFGHDIESSWLLLEAAEVLQDVPLTDKVRAVGMMLANATLREGLDPDDGAVYNERNGNGRLDKSKDWWPQAEAVIGFWNAWQLSGDSRFRAASLRTWEVIQRKFIDHGGGEWRWRISEDGTPDLREDKAGPWKGPYHNARMCMEMIHRLNSNRAT